MTTHHGCQRHIENEFFIVRCLQLTNNTSVRWCGVLLLLFLFSGDCPMRQMQRKHFHSATDSVTIQPTHKYYQSGELVGYDCRQRQFICSRTELSLSDCNREPLKSMEMHIFRYLPVKVPHEQKSRANVCMCVVGKSPSYVHGGRERTASVIVWVPVGQGSLKYTCQQLTARNVGQCV